METSQVLIHYPSPYQPTALEPLGSAGGFSGATLWKLSSPAGSFCLRRWPSEHPSRQRLQWIHDVLFYVAKQGYGLLPTPIRSISGASYIAQGGHFWELAPWLPGTADYHVTPSKERLQAALASLAQFHQAVRPLHGGDGVDRSCPALERRLEQLALFQATRVDQIQQALSVYEDNDLRTLGGHLIARFWQVAPATRQRLLTAAGENYPRQVCLRDVWHDHILLTGSQVTGIIDVGSMQLDSVATDLARLIGSLVEDDPEGWEQALAAYETIRPLTAAERTATRAIDEANVLMSGLVWLDWICCQRRQFADMSAIVRRLEGWLGRLENLRKRLCD